MVKVIQETDAPSLRGVVLALSDKLYRKKRAEKIAIRKCDGGQPLLCEYKTKTKTGRTTKRYLPLAVHKL